MVDAFKRVWVVVGAWEVITGAVGSIAVLVVVGRAMTHLSPPWLVMLGIGVVLIAVALFGWSRARMRFTVEPHADWDIVRLVVHNNGRASKFQAQVLSVVGSASPIPAHMVPWADEQLPECFIPAGGRHDLELGHGHAAAAPRHGRFPGLMMFHRPGGASDYQASLGEGIELKDHDHLQVVVSVTRQDTSAKVEQIYGIDFRQTDDPKRGNTPDPKIWEIAGQAPTRSANPSQRTDS